MTVSAADIEATGLIHHMEAQRASYEAGVAGSFPPRIHNMGFKHIHNGAEICFSTGYAVLKEKICDDMRPIEQLQAYLDEGHTLIMHNGVTFDGEALKLLGFNVDKIKIVDSLAISWFLHPKQQRHGLETWGEHFGIPKPPVTDWIHGEQEVYNNRVMMDCKIQYMLWKEQDAQLTAIYGTRPDQKRKRKEFIQYLMWKMQQQRIQQNNRWKLNRPKATLMQNTLSNDKEARFAELVPHMPQTPIRVVKTRPAKPFKKNGTLSKTGIAWAGLCKAAGKDFNTFNGGITIVKERIGGNPNAPQQVKDWLFKLGWIPETFEFKRNKETGETRQIPQINIKNSGGLVCPSIERMIEDNPGLGLEQLVGLGIVKHRLGLVNGFLRDVDVNGYILARCNGFTNTLRLKHAELVNLPSTRVKYGKELREMLEVEEGYLNLGADLSSLEDRIKHHFQIPLDPEYVKTQLGADYDPHMYIAVQGQIMTQGQYDEHILYEKTDGALGKKHSKLRSLGKGTNYSCQYGAGAATVARSAKCSLDIGKTLHAAYWAANWSIKEIARQQVTKEVGGTKYLLNPINGFWYWLKKDKDKFSTLCQGTGAYVFDTWCEKVNEVCLERYGKEMPLIAQFHDELILKVRDHQKSIDAWESIMKEAMIRVNLKLQMNRDMASDVQFGTNYSQIH
jgi:DNA polymerase I-like protein with 3'-5' exonuclease and polymerase domains